MNPDTSPTLLSAFWIFIAFYGESRHLSDKNVGIYANPLD